MIVIRKVASLSFLLVVFAFFSVDALAANAAEKVKALQAVDLAWVKA